MSDTPSSDSQPGAPAGGPAKGGTAPNAPKKGGGGGRKTPIHQLLVRQTVPIIATAITLVVLFGIYMGVRAARVGERPSNDRRASAPKTFGNPKDPKLTGQALAPLKLRARPSDGWKVAPQGGVAGGGARDAYGPKGAKRFALFVTRYPLVKNPRNDKDRRALEREVRRSMMATGAPATIAPQRIDDSRWWYRYTTAEIKHRTLIVHRDNNVYQLACQYPVGEDGAAILRGCDRIQRPLAAIEEKD